MRGEKVSHRHCLGTAEPTLFGKRSFIILRDQPLPFVTGVVAVDIGGRQVTDTINSKGEHGEVH